MYREIQIENKADRQFVDAIVKAEDIVRISWDLEDGGGCPDCNEEIGLDDSMIEYEGLKVEIRRLTSGWEHLRCGAKVFNAVGWMWSTCWIDRFYPINPPQARWQI